MEYFLQESVYEDDQSKKYLPAVSTSLALAAGVGILEAIALSNGSGFLMNSIGVSAVRQCLLS